MPNPYNVDRIREDLFKVLSSNSDFSMDDFNKALPKMPNNPIPKIDLKFENRSTNPNPEYATAGSSAFDLRANVENVVWLSTGDISIIPTGLFFEIPENFEIQIRPRSGLAAKNGVTVLNSPGTIDSDYRGEIKIILINHGRVPFCVKHGDRIAQAVVASVLNKNIVNLSRVEKILDNTERSAGGFGHTGLQ